MPRKTKTRKSRKGKPRKGRTLRNNYRKRIARGLSDKLPELPPALKLPELPVPGLDTAPPLVDAVYNSDIERIKELLNDEADINVQDKFGYTPLTQAVGNVLAEQDDMNIVKLLMRNGADINIKDEKGRTVEDHINNDAFASADDKNKLKKAIGIKTDKTKTSKSTFGKLPRCPNGYRRNRKTGNCDPKPNQ